VGAYLYSGGSLTPLWEKTQEAARDLPATIEKAGDWIRAASEKASEYVGKGRDLVEDLDENFPDSLPELPDLPPLKAGPAVPFSGGGEDLVVYFGPSPPSDPNGIDDSLVAFLAAADTSIDCACYELQHPAIAEVLVAEHAEGTTVRLVTDSHYRDRPALQRVIAAGIPVVFDDRSPYMHNKFCVVDDKAVWTGSMNFSENGAHRNNNNALRIMSTNLAANYDAEFLEMFDQRSFGGRSPENTPFPALTIADIPVACYFAPEDDVEEVIVAALEQATTSIDFLAFSFTSKPIARVMADKAEAGVQVRGIFETRAAGGRYSRDEFLAGAGAAIFHDGNPYTMHHKVIIIDGKTVITGSYNFSKSADEKNDENLLILESPEIAAAYTEEFVRILGR
jgi:phosphatidylserine/phosphatidylglycerophosphate/cardiolipin synthase-like enzyme